MPRKRWSYSVGPHGARVRVAEKMIGGNVVLYAWDKNLGGHRKKSLGFRVRDASGKIIREREGKAKKEAAAISNRWPDTSKPASVATVGSALR